MKPHPKANDVLALHKRGHAGQRLTFAEIGERVDLSRNAVAGIVWRAQHPGLWKLGTTDRDRREYDLRRKEMHA